LQASGAGTIVVNGSIAAWKCFPNHPAYCASKAAVVVLARQMAADYAPRVRVNAICPGPVDTPLIWESAAAFSKPAEAVQAAGERTPMGRLGAPEDFAKLALFLSSEESGWITGATYTLDGGATLG
jgi:NAD(P)-dependent dehydrogenase (short-subunit alcohol dehydrogenase family)